MNHTFMLLSYSEYFAFCISNTDYFTVYIVISTVKWFIENWFEGYLFLEGQTAGTGNHGYDLDKVAEGYIAKHLRHWEWNSHRLSCPWQRVSPQNCADPREVLTCWTELLRSNLTPTPARGSDRQGYVQYWHNVKYNRKLLNSGWKHWVPTLLHLGRDALESWLQERPTPQAARRRRIVAQEWASQRETGLKTQPCLLHPPLSLHVT